MTSLEPFMMHSDMALRVLGLEQEVKRMHGKLTSDCLPDLQSVLLLVRLEVRTLG
jgi:hypothetical protein